MFPYTNAVYLKSVAILFKYSWNVLKSKFYKALIISTGSLTGLSISLGNRYCKA